MGVYCEKPRRLSTAAGRLGGNMTYDELVKIGLELPEVEDTFAWRTPALKRNGRYMLRLKEDGETIAVKLSWDSHDRMLSERPDLYFKTPHYEGYPALLARLEDLSLEEAGRLVQRSWEDAPFPGKGRPRPSNVE
jgi:hypothetical protein